MRRILLSALGAAACAPMVPLPEPSGPCAVTETMRGRYIGTKFRLRDRDEIQYAANARLARVVREGDAVTMDHRADRLDILLDETGRVEGLRCG